MLEQGVSKRQAIRDYLTKHPDATASVTRPALVEQGIEVSIALLVGQIKQKMKGGAKTRKKAAKTKVGRKPVGKKTALTAADLVEAKKLVDDLGGIDQARKALEFLEELG